MCAHANLTKCKPFQFDHFPKSEIDSQTKFILAYLIVQIKVTNNRQVKVTKAQQTTGAGEPMVEAGQPHQVFLFL